jgi:Tol biopolymer transport system component
MGGSWPIPGTTISGSSTSSWEAIFRLTQEGSDHHDPVWSPDGTRIAFGSERGSTGVDIWIKDVGGDGPARPLLEMEGTQFPKEWTADDLLVIQTDHAGRLDLYTMPADGSADPRPYLRADWNDGLPRVSPDGRWLAYQSSSAGACHRGPLLPGAGRAFLVSEPGVGAMEPVWSPDGTTVYYRQMPSEEIIAAEVTDRPGVRGGRAETR